MQNQLLFNPSVHYTIDKLIKDKFIMKAESSIDQLSLELKYMLVQLSSIGAVVFLEDRIQLAEGMESWMQLYWREESKTW